MLLLRGTNSIHLMAYHTVDQTLMPLADPMPNRPFYLTYFMGDYLLLPLTSQQSDDFDQIFAYNMRHDAGQIYHKKTHLTWAQFTPGFTVHGDWLLILLDERHLLLALPHEGYSQVVAYEEFADCYGMAWVSATD